VSYDPFVARRLSMLYRVVRFGRLDEGGMAKLKRTLAAIRPVVTSQLLGEWLASAPERFSEGDACTAVAQRLTTLPPTLFVEPELRRDPRAMVRAALPLMVGWNILERVADGYRLAARRTHPQFPFVEDIVAYQASFLEETLENAAFTSVRMQPDVPEASAAARL
jgi:hypothetical protein